MFAAGDDHPLKTAVPGGLVALPSRRPPWIVVDHDIHTILINKWPGKLWAVEIVDADPQAQRELVPNVWYTRAIAVRVLEELPIDRLFGSHGECVCRIVQVARELSLEQVARLAAALPPAADKANLAAWNRWIASVDASPPVARRAAGSPINGGFGLISSQVVERARQIVGDAAFIEDEEGEETLEPVWSKAHGALLHAAMAWGAPEFVDGEGQEALTAAWRAVFGPMEERRP